MYNTHPQISDQILRKKKNTYPGNTKFRITFRYLNMYISSQKFPQIFLYMFTTSCESFKLFEELGKKFFISNFYDSEISSPAKNGLSLTAPYSNVSSEIYNLFLLELLQYIGKMFKKSLNVYDAWFGFYSHFKKGTFDYPCIMRNRV